MSTQWNSLDVRIRTCIFFPSRLTYYIANIELMLISDVSCLRSFTLVIIALIMLIIGDGGNLLIVIVVTLVVVLVLILVIILLVLLVLRMQRTAKYVIF